MAPILAPIRIFRSSFGVSGIRVMRKIRTLGPMDHTSEALAAADSARIARRLLNNEFNGPFRDNAKINDLQAKIGFGLKVAQIHATLAQAQEVRLLRQQLEKLQAGKVETILAGEPL